MIAAMSTLLEITQGHQLAEALEAECFLLFKHSQTCPTSAFAFAEYREFLKHAPPVATAWIDVISSRPLSQEVARESGIRHESPQALLFQEGRVVWHASHGAITARSLHEALSDQSRVSSSR